MARARNSLGQFTRRRAATRTRPFFGSQRPLGPEQSGVVTGETVTLGGATPEPTAAPKTTTKARTTETTES